jgi:ABC-2 type transport system ATP-binding protein
MTAEEIVAVRGVEKRYGNIRALDNVTLTVTKGEIVALLGSNGSGKSTLLKVVAGLTPQDRGDIVLFGRSPDRSVRRQIGFLFDHSAHWDALTGFENAWYFARSYGLAAGDARERLDHLFSRMALADRQDDTVSTYSYGMRRKLALIEALVHEPALLVLDEPSIGLDYQARISLTDRLREEARRGTAVLFSTNDVHEAAGIADRVALFDRGRLLAIGEPSVLVGSLKGRMTIDLTLATPVRIPPLLAVAGVEGARADERGGAFVLTIVASPDGSSAGASALLGRIVQKVAEQGGVIRGVEMRAPGLEDVFLAYMEGPNDAA